MTDRPLGAINFGVEDPESVPVRDAATVVLLRDGVGGVEAVMLLRNLRSDFVGGAYVFPGGGVDPDDGPDDAFRHAAIRESFEEAGLLLARRRDGSMVSFEASDVAARFAAHRIEVDHGRMTLAALCALEELHPATDSLVSISRWVTPLGAPRRYDTRFFVARAPEGQVALHDDREVVDHLWIRPADALARHDEGRFQLILPTRRTLEELASFDRVDDALAQMSGRDEPEVIAPTMEVTGTTAVIELPDGARYDAVTNLPLDD